jgi:hypothetical protein
VEMADTGTCGPRNQAEQNRELGMEPHFKKGRDFVLS